MHPETHWMIYQAEAAARQQQLEQRQRQHLLAYPCLRQRVAFRSGHYLLRCAQWLLRYGQPYEQWTPSITAAGRR